MHSCLPGLGTFQNDARVFLRGPDVLAIDVFLGVTDFDNGSFMKSSSVLCT